MLEIARGRTWSVAHTIYDDYEAGTLADLSHITEVRCQIREKTAVRDRKGIFAHPLVANVTATLEESILTLSLTRAATAALQPADYIIDVVGSDVNGVDESLLDPEPIKVVNRPTSAFADDAIPEVPAVLVPDFSGEFETALVD
jgi:hypothetical protein